MKCAKVIILCLLTLTTSAHSMGKRRKKAKIKPSYAERIENSGLELKIASPSFLAKGCGTSGVSRECYNQLRNAKFTEESTNFCLKHIPLKAAKVFSNSRGFGNRWSMWMLDVKEEKWKCMKYIRNSIAMKSVIKACGNIAPHIQKINLTQGSYNGWDPIDDEYGYVVSSAQALSCIYYHSNKLFDSEAVKVCAELPSDSIEPCLGSLDYRRI